MKTKCWYGLIFRIRLRNCLVKLCQLLQRNSPHNSLLPDVLMPWISYGRGFIFENVYIPILHIIQVTNLYQLVFQASKEMICFTRFQVHGLAVFIQNGNGHYEALNRNCPHYYLSEDSIALFLENLPSGQHYIVGQIVHIDRSIVRSASGSPGESEISGSNVGGGSRCNPYGLPVGTEFFVVTVAMVPDFSPLSLTM